MKKKYFLLFFFFCVSILTFDFSQLYSQQPTLEWQNIYYGPDTMGKAEFIVLDKLRNIYVSGTTNDIAEGDNIVTIKYSNAGIQQWLTVYNGPANAQDIATGMVIDDSDNIYITGFSVGIGTGEDFIAIKYNPNGIQQWVARYNDPNNLPDGANSIALDNKGFLYVTGTISTLPNGRDAVTIKYNAFTGDSIWVRNFHESGTHGNYYDYGIAVKIDKQDNCFVTGSSDANFGPPYADYLTLKYDSSGTLLWSQKYDGPTHYNDLADFIALDTTGNVYVSGTSYNSSGTEDYATIKYSNAGVQQWVQRYTNNGLGGGRNTGLVLDKSGNVYITGGLDGGVDSYYATVKYSTSGIQLWVQRYDGGYGGSNANGICLDYLDNVYVTGYSQGNGTGGSDCVTLKYNTSGVPQWTARYNGPENLEDWGNAVIVDTSGNVFVTGWTEFYNGNYKPAYLTLKYTQPSGISQISGEIPKTIQVISKLSQSI